VVGNEMEATHGLAAQACPQALEEAEGLRVVALFRPRQERECDAGERARLIDDELQGTDGLGECQLLEPDLDQLTEMLCIAAGLNQIEAKGALAPVAMHQSPDEPPSPRATPAQETGKLQQEPSRGELKSLRVADLMGEVEHALETRGRLEGYARVRLPTQGTVEQRQELRAEAPGQSVTRQAQAVTEVPQPQPCEGLRDILIKTQNPEGQATKNVMEVPGIGEAYGSMPPVST